LQQRPGGGAAAARTASRDASMLIRGEGVAAAVATAAQRSIARDFSYDRGSRMDAFHGENVS